MASHGHLLQHPDEPPRTRIHLWDHRYNLNHEVRSEPKSSKGVAVIMESHGLLEDIYIFPTYTKIIYISKKYIYINKKGIK